MFTNYEDSLIVALSGVASLLINTRQNIAFLYRLFRGVGSVRTRVEVSQATLFFAIEGVILSYRLIPFTIQVFRN